MQNVEALHTLEPRQNVGRRVPKGVPNMQPGATGVREHVEDVALGLGGVEAVAEVRGAEGAVLLPVRLPPRLDLVVRVRPPRLPRAWSWSGGRVARAIGVLGSGRTGEEQWEGVEKENMKGEREVALREGRRRR